MDFVSRQDSIHIINSLKIWVIWSKADEEAGCVIHGTGEVILGDVG